MIVEKTTTGLDRILFRDRQYRACLLQQSCPSTEIGKPAAQTAVWLGLWDDAMSLDRCMVAELVVHLKAWLETGSFQLETKP